MVTGLLLASIACLLACDRNVEPFVPGEKPASPDLSKIFPEPPDAEGPMGAEMQDVPTAPGRGAAPASIQGTVALAEELAGDAPADAVLFVIARPAGVAAGPPLASRRFEAPRFPLRFEIGQQNVMLPGNSFRGEIQLSARLDRDGNPMTRLPGDLQGSASRIVAPGAQGVEIVLRERL